MPDAFAIIHALPAACDKSAHLLRVEFSCRRNHDQIGMLWVCAQRYKGLAAEWMAFHDFDGKRQAARLGAEQAQYGLSAFALGIGTGERMIAFGGALVDRIVARTFQHNDFAKRGKGSAAQGFGDELWHSGLRLVLTPGSSHENAAARCATGVIQP